MDESMIEHTTEVPHRWDGWNGVGHWTCLLCGRVSPDPCDCLCRDVAVAVDQTFEGGS